MTRYQHQKCAVDFAHPFVDLIWFEINKRKLSHTDIAKAAGVDARSMRRWRDGDALPSLEALECVLSVLGFELIVRPQTFNNKQTNPESEP